VEVYAVDVLEVWREMTNAAALALAKAATASDSRHEELQPSKLVHNFAPVGEREDFDQRSPVVRWALRESRAITRFGDETSCGVRRGHAHELGQRGARQGATHFERAVPLEFVQGLLGEDAEDPVDATGIESELCQPHL